MLKEPATQEPAGTETVAKAAAYRSIPIGVEGAMDDINLNDVTAVARISIASPEQVLEWASRHRRQSERSMDEGEATPVRRGEEARDDQLPHVQAREGRPVLRAHLRPVKDWECACGKYKRIKYKGIICDRCGVEVTESKVRRVRMGYIQLAAPVCHIWFYKGTSSKISNLLDISVRDLGKVIYFQEYIVVEAAEETGSRPRKQLQRGTGAQVSPAVRRQGAHHDRRRGGEGVPQADRHRGLVQPADAVEMREATSPRSATRSSSA
jgi:hypothetical protein